MSMFLDGVQIDGSITLNNWLAPNHDKNVEYKAGAICLYLGVLKRAKEDTTGPFDESKWENAYLSDGGFGGGGQPVVIPEPKLLWENPNPSTIFAAQSIPLDLSGYVGVIVRYKYAYNDDNTSTCVYCKKTDGEIQAGGKYRLNSTRRSIKIDDTQVLFGDGILGENSDQSFVIPTEIYGVSEVLVETKPEDAPVLLWSNRAPSSNFSAQTIELDLREYDGVIIEANSSTNNRYTFTRGYIKKNDTSTDFGIGGHVGVRTVKVNDAGVTFGLAYYSDTLSTQDRCIPINIYGVKKVVVEVESNAPDLLWVNSAPSSAFVSQTVSVDLTEYDGVLVEFNNNNTSRVLTSRVYIKKSDNRALAAGRGDVTNDGRSRVCEIVSGGVKFYDTKEGGSTSNDSIIPYKIYGVKGVVVEPIRPIDFTTVERAYTFPRTTGTTNRWTVDEDGLYIIAGDAPAPGNTHGSFTFSGEASLISGSLVPMVFKAKAGAQVILTVDSDNNYTPYINRIK